MTEEEHIAELTVLLRKTAPPEMTDDELQVRVRQLLHLYKILVWKPPKE
jgi:hypothetical protein